MTTSVYELLRDLRARLRDIGFTVSTTRGGFALGSFALESGRRFVVLNNVEGGVEMVDCNESFGPFDLDDAVNRDLLINIIEGHLRSYAVEPPNSE
jgi:hypothetical protein